MSQNRQYLKAIVWPHPPTKEIPHYRYIIAGILITEEPISSLEGKNLNNVSEFLIDSEVFGLSDLIDLTHKGTPNITCLDAADWLLSLESAEICKEK